MSKKRLVQSERSDLIDKAREAMLSAVQIYNNPLIGFKTESFIVLSLIAWTYLLHAYYVRRKLSTATTSKRSNGENFCEMPMAAFRHWDLKHCMDVAVCPLDKNTINNLIFLIGLRNQIEHKKAVGLDSYLSARYQACALNFNFYLKKLHGGKFGLDHNLALSLQFAELDYAQAQVIKDKEDIIPPNVMSYIAAFDARLSNQEIESERFAYRLLFTRVTAKRHGQADRVIEFIDPNSEMAKNISKDYWVKEETEKPKLSAKQVVRKVREAVRRFRNASAHTILEEA